MSYRLINSNALAMSCTEVNNLPCIYADLPNGLDGGYYDMTQDNADKSRWHELFGTPERATQTLVTQNFACGVWGDCLRCPFGGSVCPENLPISEDAEQKMLEWLRGDAE